MIYSDKSLSWTCSFRKCVRQFYFESYSWRKNRLWSERRKNAQYYSKSWKYRSRFSVIK